MNYKPRSKGISEESEEEIVELYSQGNSIRKINQITGFTIQDIRKAFKKFNVEPNTHKFYRERLSNKNAFSNIDEEECAYLYGWLLSDGCYTNGSVVLSVNSKDVEVLELLKNYVGTRNNVFNGEGRDSRTGKVYQKSSFTFKDDDIIERLISFGMEERKSAKETLPRQFEFNRHFWRGMIDGDGSISKTSNEISLVGSSEIVEAFGDYCKQLFPDCKPKYYTKGKLSVFSLCSKIYSKQVLDELYRDCTNKLSRKYKIYLEKYYGTD